MKMSRKQARGWHFSLKSLDQGGGGVTKAPFVNFSISQIHIWQVSLQLSCGDTCQIERDIQ